LLVVAAELVLLQSLLSGRRVLAAVSFELLTLTVRKVLAGSSLFQETFRLPVCLLGCVLCLPAQIPSSAIPSSRRRARNQFSASPLSFHFLALARANFHHTILK